MTFEEISKYPVGSIIECGEKAQHEKGYWCNEEDKHIIKNKREWIELEFDNNTYNGIYIKKYQYTIQGWLYDGKEWFVVEENWDGWNKIIIKE